MRIGLPIKDYNFILIRRNNKLVISIGGLVDAAKEKGDYKLLMHISNDDCVATEVHYHTSCHKNYIRKQKQKQK